MSISRLLRIREPLLHDIPSRRALAFLAWLLAFLGLMSLIGMLPTIFVFVALYMHVEGRERPLLMLASAGGLTLFSYVLFDRLLALPWPRTVVGDWFPLLKDVVPSL